MLRCATVANGGSVNLAGCIIQTKVQRTTSVPRGSLVGSASDIRQNEVRCTILLGSSTISLAGDLLQTWLGRVPSFLHRLLGGWSGGRLRTEA